MAMSSASAVISDCDGVPGQQSRCTLCKQRLRGARSHPGQWKSELQQFLLKYSEISGSSCVCKACEHSIGSDGDCMANTKENIFPVGLNKTLHRKAMLLCTRLWQTLRT